MYFTVAKMFIGENKLVLSCVGSVQQQKKASTRNLLLFMDETGCIIPPNETFPFGNKGVLYEAKLVVFPIEVDIDEAPRFNTVLKNISS